MMNSMMSIINSNNVISPSRINQNGLVKESFDEKLKNKLQSVQPVTATYSIRHENRKEQKEAVETKIETTEEGQKKMIICLNARIVGELTLKGEVKKEERLINSANYRHAYQMD